ncbi:MAG: IS3 family transposase [Candidatus Accumulibacter sp.]|nr:IS3 family transposase [Accumulibacter sp.]
MKRFKNERVQGIPHASHADMRAVSFEYIEGFHNRKRLHSTLGHRSPVQFPGALDQPAPAGKTGSMKHLLGKVKNRGKLARRSRQRTSPPSNRSCAWWPGSADSSHAKATERQAS